MSRTSIAAILVVILVIIIGGFYAYEHLESNVVPETAATSTAPTSTAPTIMASQQAIEATTSVYTINVIYPQFGIPAIDSSIASIATNAVDQFQSDASTTNPSDLTAGNLYSLTGQYNSVYTSPSIVSAEMIITEYTGGAHPNAAVYGLNYDPSTGSAITLDDALSMMGLTLQQVSTQAQQQITAQYGANGLFASGLDPTADNYGTFIINANSVTFIFQEYQVAPYSDGTPTVTFARKDMAQ